MKEGKYSVMPTAYYQQLKQAVVQENWTRTMKEMLSLPLRDSFPYEDLKHLIADHPRADMLDGADWNTYWMDIAAAVYHVCRGKLPSRTLIAWCSQNFFSRHPEWILQDNSYVKKYPVFYREYKTFELARFYVLFLCHQKTRGCMSLEKELKRIKINKKDV
ncbi:YxiJ-like family protein [Terribacillus sp. DMT04]|uniref:YxiJ-like family protein n=1 Tax=Terribacillus sp. DMT04 TaxID=2850441 RepID=UPI001C2C51C1|nr:YxiJ-like family protein [Terribacillus sp. DMT04]QXE00645.1 YxiJ-like family protein [Terribacillus sp. DMT04]